MRHALLRLVVLLAAIGTAPLGVPSEARAGGAAAWVQTLEPCVRSQGYWSTHPAEWPVSSLVLGNAGNPAHTYSASELLSFLRAPVRNDASLVLAQQLIAAKLNVASGARPDPVAAQLARADELLGLFTGRLPYRLGPRTPVGGEMTTVARVLEAYNKGEVPGSCGPVNRAPVANAGPDQTVALGATVTLNGTGSSDADGEPLTFNWTFVSVPQGSGATLDDGASPAPTFVADVAGRYEVRLVVNDGTLDSTPDTVVVSTLNSAPTAHAGPDQTLTVGATAQLTGAASTDPDGDPLTYAWSFVSGPAGSGATLSDPTAVLPTFVVDLPGTYVVQLVVSDGELASEPDTVTITTTNSAPVARAGDDATGAVGERVTLNGSASSDVDGDPLTYRWSFVSRPAGSQAALENDATAMPAFTIDAFGEYVVQLIVNDGTVDSAADTVIITTRNTPPVAEAGPDRSILTGALVTLDGSGSSDVDGHALTYRWALVAVPLGSAAQLSDLGAVRSTFTADLPGTYVAQLIVNDGTVDSGPDTVSITTDNSPPLADAGADLTGLVGQRVTLDGSGSSDVDGNPLTFRWSFVSRPAGSQAVLEDAASATPAFTIDAFGQYVVQLIVNDGTVDGAPDTVVIDTENSPPVAVAGPDQTVAVDATVTLDGAGSTDVDGQALTYQWSLLAVPAGSAAALSDASAVRPTFTADLPGIYVAQLVVNDGIVDSAADTVTITAEVVDVNEPPVANAGLDQTVDPGAIVQLDGSGSSDADGDPLTYLWSLSRPSGSNAALSNPIAVSPTFVVDLPGAYVAQLIVNDGTVDSAPDSVTISTTNTAPVANAGPDQRLAIGATVTLDGSASSDANGTPLAYQWSILSQPADGTAALSNPAAVNPTFTANVAGDYVVQLIVNDGLADSAPDTVVITASAPADLAFRADPLDAQPALGAQFQVWFYVRNNGPSPATSVTASIPTPAGLRYSHYAAAIGSFDGNTWTIPNTMPSGTEYWITLVYFAETAGTRNLTASVATSDQVDPVATNNAATLVITPNANADLQISLLAPPTGTITPGSSVGPSGLFFQIVNAGPARASNVVLNFLPPAGITVTGSSAGAGVYPGDYHPSTGVWTIGPMAAGTGMYFILSAVVNPTGPTGLTASLSGTEPDPNPANNVVINPPINRPPVANAGASRTVGTYEPVTLDASATTDPEGDPLSFAWTNTLRPMSSAITLANATTATPAFTPDLPGVYTFQLTASDGRGGVNTSSVTITAEERNRPPVIGSTAVTVGAVGAPYRYAIYATDPDAGDTLAFSLVTAPEGMTINASTGVIDWVPGAAQAGPQAVEARVQDAAGRFVTQSWVVQVSSSANQAPVAADDAYDVRLGESLSVGAAGVLQNDVDESPLAAALVAPPSNGTVALNADGSFTYTPYTQRAGELVMAQGINLAARVPGVSMSGTPGSCPQCLIDEDPVSHWISATSDAAVQMQFPQDVTVSELRIQPFQTTAYNRVTAGIFSLRDAQGTEIYNSGNVGLSAPLYYGRLVLPAAVSGVRSARFVVTGGAQGWTYNAGFAEMQVIGSALLPRTAFVETNLAQRLATQVTASSYLGFNVPEAINDDTLANWYAADSTPGQFIEIAFPEDVTVSGLRAGSASGRPDGLGSSLGYSCSGNFRLHAADGTVLWDSGLVSHPSTLPNQNLADINYYTPTVPNVSGVRSLRYELTSCLATSAFPLGFSEIQVFGTPSSTAPAFDAGKRLHALLGREVHSTPIIVNLSDDNADGRIDVNDVPDIVAVMESTTSQLRGEIKVVSGDDGRVLFTAGGPDQVSPWSEMAAGDIDGDGLPEIIAVHADGNGLIALEHDGTLKWRSETAPMPSFNLGSILYTGAVSIANLDGAGRPEIIVGATVFDADGRLLGRGQTMGGTTGGTGLRSAISAVADIDLDGTPELVAGPTAYRLAGGALTRVWQRADREDGFAGIGNFDDDPEAEIAMVANGVVYLLNHDGSDAEVWNAAASGAPVQIPGGGQGGAPLVADVDGDGYPEIGVAGATSFVVFNRDGSVRWRSTISDRSSNSTGSVAFDLDGDGAIEIIYRDEYFLRIYRGSDGRLLGKIPVSSATWAEVPTVADVDNDGHADIVVSSDVLNAATDSGIIVINDALNLWKRTRRTWNQHAYQVTNVNEDGTVPLVETPHWLLPGLNGFRTNAFPEYESAESSDAFTYVARDGVLQSNVATVRINVWPVNAAPRFTSSAVVTAAREVAYTYAARAIDPDAGDILSYSLPAAPGGMTIDSASGFVRWTPTAAQQGAHDVIVKVKDVRGLFALQAYTVMVGEPVAVPDVVGQAQAAAEGAITDAALAVGAISTRNSPTVPTGAVISQSPLPGTLVAAGSPVSLSVSTGPAPVGTVPDVVGQAQASAQADIVAAQFVVGPVSGQTSATAPIGVVLSQSPAAGTTAATGSPIALVVSLGPPPGTLDVDGDGYTGDMGDCNDTDPAINPGAFDIPGDGIDQNCNGVDSIVGDDTPPTALLVTPDDLAEVTMPTDIVGTVGDANFLRYTVQLAEVDETTFLTIVTGTVPVTNGVVGRIDPTLLENGLYRVRLIAEDVNGQTAVDERVYRVTGEMKVGMFGLSFVDLRVPMQGIPITVVRSYDSRVKTGRDFGIGWRLQVSAGRLRHNRPPGEGWIIQDRPFLGDFLPCIGGSLETRSHLTEVRLSDREYYTFALEVNNGNVGITGACEGVASFRYLSGTLPGATLEILDGTGVIYLRGGDDTLLDMNDWLDGTPRVFGPRRVRLSTIDGRRIELDLSAGVTRIEDNNANAVSITPSGIQHSSGRSIAFARDDRGRITRITDPMGRAMDYLYTDDDLTTFIDRAGNATTFSYDNQHHLLEMHDPLGNRAVLAEYDAAGRLTAVTDARGQRTVFSHDIDGREEIVTDAEGRPTRFVYDDRGNVLSQDKTVTVDGVPVVSRIAREYDAADNEAAMVDPDGVRAEGIYVNGNLLEDIVDPAGLALRTVRTYDARGEVLTVTNPAGDVMSYDYDGRGNLTTLTDAAGTVTALSYDDGGRPTLAVDATGGRKRLAYDASGRVIREEQLDAAGVVLTRVDFTHDANGNILTRAERQTVDGVLSLLITRFAYDALNRLVATTDPLGGTTRTEYNAVGRQSASVDALGRRTTFTYDEVGALVRTDFPDGSFESLTYDPSGNVARRTDRAGRTTAYEYDELGRRVRVVRPDGTSTRTVYSAGGRATATIDARGNRTDHEYDAAGRRTRTVLPAVRNAVTGANERPEVSYEYDAAGRIAAVTDANGRRTTLAYDGMGRLLRRTFADGTDRENVYDALGHVVEQRDEAGRVTRFDYDALGRLSGVTDALGGFTRYSYDETGQLRAQTDALGRTTTFERDALGRPRVRRLPGGGVETFSYDAAGNRVAETDFNGTTVLFDYDVMNRLERKSYPGGDEVTFTYTPTGRRATATDARGTTTREYDLNDQLVRVTHPGGEVIQYAYDADRNMRQLQTTAATVDYTRDSLGRVVAVDAVVNGTSLGESRYGYDPAGNIVEQTRPNGVTTRLAYDARNRPTSLAHLAGGTTIGSFAYELSATGRRTRVTELGGGVVVYGYDALDRLISEVREGSLAVAYEYDAVGNRTRMVRDGTATGYTYDVDDRLLSAGAAAFTYDVNGNVVSRTLGGATTTYDWDAEGRLVRATGPGGVTEFTYDVDGNRVARQAGGTVTSFLVDANNPTGLPQVLEERGSAGELRAQYTYGVDRVAVATPATTGFYATDALGSTRLLTDAAGAVTDQYQYDAFGILTAEAGTTPNPYLFAGEQFEPSLGLYNLRARNYDSTMGRFTGRDPLPGNVADPRSKHPYLYAHGDPVNATDPTGLFSLIEISTALGIQDVLKAIDLGRTAVQFCALTGKAEIAQEALFWGQLPLAGYVLGETLFGDGAFNASAEVTLSAKRFVNVFKSPEKIVEAKTTIGFEANATASLTVDLKRQDELTFGGTINLLDPENSKFNIGAGPVSFSFGPGSGVESELGVKKAIEIFKTTRCDIELLKGSLELGAKVTRNGPKLSAAVVLEALLGLVKFNYPIIPE
jgi:RHS repeat-associated protein